MRLAENVGLELHQEIVDSGAAIHAQLAQLFAGIGLHGFHQLARLIGDAFKRGAHDVRASGGARDAR